MDAGRRNRRWESLQAKLSVLTAILVIAFVWGVTGASIVSQRTRVESLLKEQLTARVQYMAAEIDDKVRSRVEGLVAAAARIDKRRLGDPKYVQDYLEQRYLFQAEFTAGTSVITADGINRGDYPVAPGRRGTYYGDRDYFRQALATKRPYIDKPIMGRALKRPVLTIGVPITDGAGAVLAVVTGIVDLTAPSFFGIATDPRIQGNTEITVVSLRDETIVASTNKQQLMSALPASGRSPILDRVRAGFEGAVVSVGSDGIEDLYAVARVPSADWILLQAVPTAVAFEPVAALRNTLLAAASLATLVAFLAVAWLSRRMLTPLRRIATELDAMSSGREAIRHVEEAGDLELRTLLASFNRLTSTLQSQQADLQRSERTYRSLFSNMLNGFAYLRMEYAENRPCDCIYVAANPAFAEKTGLRDVVGRRVGELVPGIWQGNPELLEMFARVVRSRLPESAEIYVAAMSEWFDMSVYALEDDLFAVVFDVVTERKQQQIRIDRLVRVYAVLSGINSTIVRVHDRPALLQAACDIAVGPGKFSIAWIGLIGDDGRTLRVVAARGVDMARLEEISILEEVPQGQGTAHEALASKRAVFCNDITQVPRRGPVRLQALEQDCRSVCALPLIVDGVGVGVMGLHAKEAEFFDAEEVRLLDELAADISFALQYIDRDERLSYLAYYDALTGLPNRTLFLDRLSQLLRGCDPAEVVAVVLVDIGHFGHINETFGRQVGDALLKGVAERLAAALREPWSLARTGPDTFAIAIGGLAQASDAAGVIDNRILNALKAPFRASDAELSISVQTGVAVYPADADSADSLYHNAEVALKEARATNSRFYYYSPEINARIAADMALEAALKDALETRQFVMHYQPRVDLRSGEIVGAEALIRWEHPANGLILPGDFIPLAERTGLIVPLSSWVIDTVCAQQAKWLAEGLEIVPVAINVSPAQLGNEAALPPLASALGRYSLDARYLELELTENVVMRNRDLALAAMHAFRKVGLRLSLDDFGTGYSSLAYLQKFPFDFVKIDRAFVSDITQNPANAAIATAVIAMAHRLGLRVIAEGVETEGQLHYLRQHDCDQIQGFHFSQAVDAEEFAAMLRAGKRIVFDTSGADDRRTLLIVDDEPSILSALQRTLRREGYRILQASGGEEALELLARHEVQVIVSDQRMAGMSGSDFLGIVKELYPDTIRIILSGYTELKTVTDAVNRGAVYKFLTKPWDDDLLKEHVRDAFLRYQPDAAAKRMNPANP